MSKIDENGTSLRNISNTATPIGKILSDLESRSQDLFNKLQHDYFWRLYLSRSFKVMVNFDLDDLMTLKPCTFWLAIQGLHCFPITASKLNWLLYKSTLLRKNCPWPWPLYTCFSSSIIFGCPFTDIVPLSHLA